MCNLKLFKKTVSVPTALYKYRQWTNGYCKRAITNNEVFFNSPNYYIREIDEWDCNAQFKEPSYEDVYDWYFDDIKKKKNIPLFEVKIYAEYYTWMFFQEEKARQLREKINITRNESYGLLCLTDRPDNLDIWSFYGNDGIPFCVGYDTEKLMKCTGCHQIKDIEYIEGVPQDSDCEEFEELFHVNFFQKNKKFEYEQEYRMIKMWPYVSVPENDNRRIVSVPDHCITEIYIPRSMPEIEKKDIVECIGGRWDIIILDI